ncbi:hypothetical protein CERSUDRAFT_80642 [Gelatoporia subvermispora B]|uniref:Ferritin-like domain-containing protein n=1 Tax=Ceriporiopsis subvermispora (strain B) TaxID=914234 RepID=M2RQ63_CERS8|nr:hypothetical protein CERSUDRAFT_80642 [Gelatoporia subvermispora B]
MLSIAILSALVAPLLVSAAPLRRQAANSTDVLVLQFADVLEQFESQFYSQALSTFVEQDFIEAGFIDATLPIQQFTSIQSDESTHDSALQAEIAALGGTPITGCSFDFTEVLSDVVTMASTARIVENVGVSAYLGAAHVISDPQLLTIAASIMSVEARHQTVLNILNGGSSIPQAFDIAFSPEQVLAIASEFISGCDLPFTANPTLTVTNTGSMQPGDTISFSSSALNGSTDGLFCQMLVGGAPTSISLAFSACVVPSGIDGPVALFITSDSQPIDNNIVNQNTNTIVAGPTLIFVDTVVEELSEVAITGSATASASSSESTISPAQASAIISSSDSDSSDSSSSSSSSDGTVVVVSTSVVASPGGPNLYSGDADDGSVTVNGWSMS